MMSLGGQLDSFHLLEASDQRDKIYATLGISLNDPSSSLIPNCKKSWAAVFEDTTKYILGLSITAKAVGIQDRVTILADVRVLGALHKIYNNSI